MGFLRGDGFNLFAEVLVYVLIIRVASPFVSPFVSFGLLNLLVSHPQFLGPYRSEGDHLWNCHNWEIRGDKRSQ